MTVCVGLALVIVALPPATQPPVGPPAIAAVEAMSVEATRPLVVSSMPRRILEGDFLITLSSERDREIGQELGFFVALVAARHTVKRARAFEVHIEVVGKPEADTDAGRLHIEVAERNAGGRRTIAIPNLRRVEEHVRFDVADIPVRIVGVVSHLEIAADAAVAGDGAREVAATD